LSDILPRNKIAFGEQVGPPDRRQTRLPVSLSVEAVEKVPKQILGRDAEKNDLAECAIINDLILGKGQVTPENIVLTGQKDFSYRLVRPQNKEI